MILRLIINLGADGETRTLMGLRPLASEAKVYTNSTTSAFATLKRGYGRTKSAIGRAKAGIYFIFLRKVLNSLPN